MKDKDQQSEEFEREQTTALLHGLRVDINTTIADAKKIATEHIQRGTGGRELALCITNLQQARMWAGEALGELGQKLPVEYRDAAKPRPTVISADEALRRYGATGLNELIRDGLIECTQNGYVLYPAIPANEAQEKRN